MKSIIRHLMETLQLVVIWGWLFVAVFMRLFNYSYSEICGATIKYYICILIVALIEYAVRNMRR